MRCIVTAGPTYEPLDAVRRLTNFSTGRLGTELAEFLSGRGNEVTLLLGEQANWSTDGLKVNRAETFSTTSDLARRLREAADDAIGAVFHAAAVSDFTFGRIWRMTSEVTDRMQEIKGGKIATDKGPLLAELKPTPKILPELRAWFPKARLVGWKYEVEGDRASAIRLAENQMAACRTDACVANGPAYGAGFGLVTGPGAVAHLDDKPALFEALERFIQMGESVGPVRPAPAKATAGKPVLPDIL